MFRWKNGPKVKFQTFRLTVVCTAGATPFVAISPRTPTARPCTPAAVLSGLALPLAGVRNSSRILTAAAQKSVHIQTARVQNLRRCFFRPCFSSDTFEVISGGSEYGARHINKRIECLASRPSGARLPLVPTQVQAPVPGAVRPKSAKWRPLSGLVPACARCRTTSTILGAYLLSSTNCFGTTGMPPAISTPRKRLATFP